MKDLRNLTDQQLVELYDEYNSKRNEINDILKQIREEAARRLNERRVKEIVFFDPKNELERGFGWESRPNKNVNYDRLKQLLQDAYYEVVTEDRVDYVKFIKRKKSPKTIPTYSIPEGVIV